MELDFTVTVILTIVSALLMVFFGYMGAKPMNVHKGPRMVPWRFLMLLMMTATLFLVVHLLNLFGIETKPAQRY